MPHSSARAVLRSTNMRSKPRRLRLRREQRAPIARRVPHVPDRPVRARRVVDHRRLLRADEPRVLGHAVGRAVEIELEVLHPQPLEHRLVVVARRRRIRVVAALLEDAVLRLERDRGVERDLGLREEARVARREVELREAGGDHALVVYPGCLAVVLAGACQAALRVS